MKILKGKPLAPGYARGQALILTAPAAVVPDRVGISRTGIRREYKRFDAAVRRSVNELENLKTRILGELDRSEAGIFDAHLALLHDPVFIGNVKKRVRADMVNVEHALTEEIGDLEKLLRQLENEYLRERSQDIRDVGQRVLKHLSGPKGNGPGGDQPVQSDTVIVARELLPSRTIELDRTRVSAFVTEKGGAQSHAAILARSLGIPYVSGIRNAATLISEGTRILVDGQTGRVTLDPSEKRRISFTRKKAAYDRHLQHEVDVEDRDCVTRDGHRISLLANIGRMDEAEAVELHNLDGVGLFRTEYLFMESRRSPSPVHQEKLYARMAAALGDKPLTIRTLDLGGDKHPLFLRQQTEENPTIGLRGLRFSLQQEKLFATQLKALLRSARRGNIRIMFPMVIGSGDFDRARQLVRDIARAEKLRDLPPVGAMIETPSAVFDINRILEQADFISIGSNDLTQFMLAADRGALDLADAYSILNPPVLRAIKHVVDAARTADKEVSLCGEAAANPACAALLVGMGIDRLSMSPLQTARVRYHLRAQKYADLAKATREALEAPHYDGVRMVLDRCGLTADGAGAGLAQI